MSYYLVELEYIWFNVELYYIVFSQSLASHNPLSSFVWSYLLTLLQVVSATAELMTETYEKLLHEDCYENPSLFESIVRLDTRIKSHFISLIAKELTDIALNKSSEGITQLRNSNIDFFWVGVWESSSPFGMIHK